MGKLAWYIRNWIEYLIHKTTNTHFYCTNLQISPSLICGPLQSPNTNFFSHTNTTFFKMVKYCCIFSCTHWHTPLNIDIHLWILNINIYKLYRLCWSIYYALSLLKRQPISKLKLTTTNYRTHKINREKVKRKILYVWPFCPKYRSSSKLTPFNMSCSFLYSFVYRSEMLTLQIRIDWSLWGDNMV